MRFVIFDDETVEPITVINLPGIAERDIWEDMRGTIRVPVPIRVSFEAMTLSPTLKMDVVELHFERFVRKGMCFTKEAELAMLLEPDFLPGQRVTVSDLRDRAERLAELIFQVLASR